MLVRKFIAPPIFTNAYLVADGESRQAAVIDPGNGVAEKIAATAVEMGVKIAFILNTHGHWDHVAGNAGLQQLTGAQILVHEGDAQMLGRATPEMRLPFDFAPSKPDGFLEEGKRLKLGTTTLECLWTPGHSPGSTCFYAKEQPVIFTGDTLFERAHGRTDFEGGNGREIRRSLARIASLPPKTRILPGHGKETTVEKESKWIFEMNQK